MQILYTLQIYIEFMIPKYNFKAKANLLYTEIVFDLTEIVFPCKIIET